MAYATAEQFKASWPSMPTTISDENVDARLADAAVVVDSLFTIPAEPDERLAGVLRLATTNMAKRSLLGDENHGMSQQQHTAGPFSESMSYRNPEGDLFLTAVEREMLESALNAAWSSGACSMQARGW